MSSLGSNLVPLSLLCECGSLAGTEGGGGGFAGIAIYFLVIYETKPG